MIFKNKKAKILVMFMALTIIGMLIYLIIATNNLDGPEVEDFGNVQKRTILTLNKKDALLLYVDSSAELAKKEISQVELAENAGFYNQVDSSNPNQDITGCGTHIYNLLSDTSGKSCVDNYDYSDEYLFAFKEKLVKYTSRDSNLKEIEFNYFDVENNYIVPKNLEQVYLLITNKDFEFNILPHGAIVDLSIKTSKYHKKVVEKILDIDLNQEPFKSMKSGKCSLYVNWLIKTAYKDESSFTGIACFPNHAWGVAACNLRNAQISPETSRVVYAGPGLSFDQLFLDGRLLKQGDILFTSTKTSWCKWSGYNFYNNDNMCGYDKGTTDPASYLRTDGEIGFCVEDSIEISGNPLYCDFSEFNIECENFPIITHIFVYLGVDGNGKHIIGNLYDKVPEDRNLKIFLSNLDKTDGVRMIVRPDYPKI